MRQILIGITGLILLGLGSCAVLGDFSRDLPDIRPNANISFQGAFLAISDADMAGTAYADGKLEPIEASDTLSLIENAAVQSSVEASNSVISWPQVVDVSPDGKYAFVVETRGTAPRDIAQYDDVYTGFPKGRILNIYSLADNSLSLISSRNDIGANPGSVEYADKSGFVVIASEDKGAELTIVGLRWDGSIREVRTLDLDIDYFPNERETYIRTAHIAPDGVTLAVNIASRRVQFFRFEIDGTGLPVSAIALGNPTEQFGKRLSVGKWTPDGRHFIITDTGWSDNALAMLVQGPGSLTTLAPPGSFGGNPKVISTVKVGLSPEGFAISEDGKHVATIDMGRTYLPETPFLSFWPGRRHYTLTLLARDKQTGILSRKGTIAQAGILPEDVIFDETGNNLAVAVFHRRKGPERRQGFIDFFSIEDGKLVSQKATIRVVRGVHDLVLVPG